MSWQSYVDDHLMCQLAHGGTLVSAAIIGQEGGVWAQSSSFPNLSTDEISKIVAGFDDSSDLAMNGMKLAGDKFMVLQGEPGAVIRGRKGNVGVCIKKTNSALVFGLYMEPVPAADCNQVVEEMPRHPISGKS